LGSKASQENEGCQVTLDQKDQRGNQGHEVHQVYMARLDIVAIKVPRGPQDSSANKELPDRMAIQAQ